jgi:hypothetical protein
MAMACRGSAASAMLPLNAITLSSAANGDTRRRGVERKEGFAAVTGKSFGILAAVEESGNLGPNRRAFQSRGSALSPIIPHGDRIPKGFMARRIGSPGGTDSVTLPPHFGAETLVWGRPFD